MLNFVLSSVLSTWHPLSALVFVQTWAGIRSKGKSQLGSDSPRGSRTVLPIRVKCLIRKVPGTCQTVVFHGWRLGIVFAFTFIHALEEHMPCCSCSQLLSLMSLSQRLKTSIWKRCLSFLFYFLNTYWGKFWNKILC